MSTVEARGFSSVFFWLQKEKTSKDHSLSNAVFFGSLQQNMAWYPGHPVAVRKTLFISRTVGLTAADSQVRKFQLKPLLQIMERKTETQPYPSMKMCLLSADYYCSPDSEFFTKTPAIIIRFLQMCLKRIINPFRVITPKYVIIKGMLLQWRVLSRFCGFLPQSND